MLVDQGQSAKNNARSIGKVCKDSAEIEFHAILIVIEQINGFK